MSGLNETKGRIEGGVEPLQAKQESSKSLPAGMRHAVPMHAAEVREAGSV